MSASSFPPLVARFAESELMQAQSTLHQFWQQGLHQSFLSFDQTRLCYSSFRHLSARAEIVLSPGRIEAGKKYQEFCFDLYQAGFTVHVIDHRGQGMSARINPDPQIGDVADFQHYVQDFGLWLHTFILPKQQAPLLGLAHSMGSAILCRYLQQQQNHGFVGAIYCSPMFGIQTQGIPTSVARGLVHLLTFINKVTGKPERYFPGQTAYQDKAFDANHLTHSTVRYQLFRQLYQTESHLQLGGVSSRWLRQSLSALDALHKAPALDLPQLILQATDDPVVDNQMQQLYQQKHKEQKRPCELVQIQGALHEIIFETDPLRQQLFSALRRFVLQLGL